MPLKLGTQRELLTFVSTEGVGSTHAQGYQWFWQKLTPALKKFSLALNPEKELIADCYYVCGDVHDFNNAPKAAIGEYLKSLEFDSSLGSAHREIASMYSNMGDYQKALRHSKKALELTPDDKCAQKDHPFIVEFAENGNGGPLYQKGDAVWEAFELLAQQDPKAALIALADRQDDEAQRARLCCFGALEETEEYLNGWKEIAKTSDQIWFEYHDWFFMETKVYEAPELWKILFESNANFNGVFTVFDGLDESKRYLSLSGHESIRLGLEYYVYEQSGDLSGLRRLHEKYPEWKELSETLNA